MHRYIIAQEINLRPASLTDTQVLAHLWVTTFPDKFGPVFGHKAEAVIHDWLRLSHRHLQTTTVAEIGQTIIGFIMLETSTSPSGDDGRWLWHALQRHNGIFGALRGLLLTLFVDNNYQVAPNEVYIEMLAVTPAWRKRGVGHCLIVHAETIARAHNLNCLGLTVTTDNTPAINLYRQIGFEITLIRHSRRLRWITGHGSYYQMVKQLT